MIDDIVAVLEDTVGEPVVAHELLSALGRVQLGRFGRQKQDGDVRGQLKQVDVANQVVRIDEPSRLRNHNRGGSPGTRILHIGNSHRMPTALPEAKREELLKLVDRIRSGKQIAIDRYLHFDNSEAVMVLAVVSRYVSVPAGANVLRIRKTQIELTMSFSQYADFYEQPFPKLVWSEHHDLISGSVIRRSEGQNPAILHRKELLLNEGDPRRISSARLTEALVTKGLLPTREFIGRHEHWQQYLYRRGFEILDGTLRALGGS